VPGYSIPGDSKPSIVYDAVIDEDGETTYVPLSARAEKNAGK
jgi:hypothetical protein